MGPVHRSVASIALALTYWAMKASKVSSSVKMSRLVSRSCRPTPKDVRMSPSISDVA